MFFKRQQFVTLLQRKACAAARGLCSPRAAFNGLDYCWISF